MAKIRNVTLNDELTQLCIETVENADDATLLLVGKINLGNNFIHAHIIRERLIDALNGPKVIETGMLIMLRHMVPGTGLISMFGAPALRILAPALAAYSGRYAIILALLLDPRDDVHEVGARWLSLPSVQVLDGASALRGMCEFCTTYLLGPSGVKITMDDPTHLKLDPDGRIPLPGDVRDVIPLLNVFRRRLTARSATIARLEKHLEEQTAKQKTRLDHAMQQASIEKNRFKTERDQARTQMHQLAQEKEKLALHLAQLQTEHQTLVARSVEQETAAVVRKWLEAPLEAERGLEHLTTATAGLLARVDQTLQEQTQHDRATGTRVELEHKLAQLRQARERLTQAAQTAIRPLPALQELLAEVENEVRRAERILTGHRPTDPLAERLLMSINRAANWSEACHQSELLQYLGDGDLLPAEDRRRLYDALQRKFSLLAETHRTHEHGATDNGWSLRDAIYRNRPTRLLLDGHNVLFRLEDVFRADYEPDGHPGRQARDHLVSILRKLVDGHPNLHARICFDSPQHHTHTVAPRLEVEYSGGQGEHRADQRLRSHVTWRRPEELDQKWFVVSDDRAVRSQAAHYGANPVPVDVFAVLLADFHCLSHEAEKPRPTMPVP